MKLTLVYDANSGYSLCDGKSEAWVDMFLKEFFENKKDQRIVIGSALLIDFFRLRLAQGVISADQIEFVYDGKTLGHNKYGRITHWPKGYCDIPIEPMEKLLTIQSDFAKKRAKKRKEMMSVDNELTGEQDIGWKNN